MDVVECFDFNGDDMYDMWITILAVKVGVIQCLSPKSVGCLAHLCKRAGYDIDNCSAEGLLLFFIFKGLG